MDLADIWQEHKKFILAVVGALVFLMVGQTVIGSQHDYEGQGDKARSIAGRLRRDADVTDRMVRETRDEVDGLRARVEELVGGMNFKPDDLYVLPPGEASPTAYCWKRIRGMQDLRDEAERQDVLIPEGLGLQDTAPTDVEDIKRTLRALNIIQYVVVYCIAADVNRIDRITIEPDSRSRRKTASFVQSIRVEFEIVGQEAALRRVVSQVVEGARGASAPYLEVTSPTEIRRSKTDPALLEMRLSVAGLDIATEDLGLENL